MNEQKESTGFELVAVDAEAFNAPILGGEAALYISRGNPAPTLQDFEHVEATTDILFDERRLAYAAKLFTGHPGVVKEAVPHPGVVKEAVPVWIMIEIVVDGAWRTHRYLFPDFTARQSFAAFPDGDKEAMFFTAGCYERGRCWAAALPPGPREQRPRPANEPRDHLKIERSWLERLCVSGARKRWEERVNQELFSQRREQRLAADVSPTTLANLFDRKAEVKWRRETLSKMFHELKEVSRS